MSDEKPTYQELENQIAELKKQNEQLQLNSKLDFLKIEEPYRFLFENSLDGFVLGKLIYHNNLPVDFKFLDVNPAFEKLLGIKNLVGRNFLDLFPSEIERHAEKFQKYGPVAENAELQKFEFYFSPLDIWLSTSLLCHGQGLFIAVLNDITINRQADQALKDSEEKYRLMLKNSGDVLILVNEKGIPIFVSDNSKTKFTDKELSEPFTNVIYQEDLTKIFGAWDRVLKDKNEIVTVQYRLKENNGIWLEAVAQNFLDNQAINAIVINIRNITGNKVAELKLKESEEKYKNFINHSPDIIYQFSNKKGGLFWSERVKDILGFSPEEIRENPFLWNNSIHPDDKNAVRDAIENFEKGANYSIDYRIKTKWGKWIWLHDYFMHKTQIDDEITIEGQASDITERKRIENELLKSEAFLFNIFEQSPYPKWISDKAGTLIKINKACLKMLKISEEEVIGKYNILNDNILKEQGFIPLVKRVFDEGEIARFELIYDSSNFNVLDLQNHTIVIIFVTIFPIIDENGQITNAIIHMIDITDRKLIEHDLKESEERFRTIFNLEPECVKIINPDCTLVTMNPAGLEMLEVESLDMVKGKSVLSMIHSEFREGFAKLTERVCENGENGQFTFLVTGNRGTERWLETHAVPLRNYNNKIIACLGVTRDITEQKRAEHALKESEAHLKELNATKDKLFSIIAHDLKSPFNSILGFSALLTKNVRKYDIEKTENYIKQINSSASRTFILLENLLTWTQNQTGQLGFTTKKLNLDYLINEIVDLSSSSAIIKNISLKYHNPSEIEVVADQNMLQTILRNLISNAIKFTNSGGKVDIYTKLQQNQVEVEVSDNGVGMDMEISKRLLDKDLNLSTNGTENEKGSGLGLMLCKEFIEKHGGIIWVESELNKGTKFKFTLPVDG